MERIITRRSGPLHGEITADPSKNSILPLMACSLLTQEPLRLRRVPRLTDVDLMLDILHHLGVTSRWDDDTLELSAETLKDFTLPSRLTRGLRASILVAGPLLSRTPEFCCAYPGGCAIGQRPVDMHLSGFAQLQAGILQEDDALVITSRHLRAATIHLEYPSVGGTENLMMAATLIPGTTTLHNAAREPEIVDVARLLQQMGAQIHGAGTSRISITGVHRLRGADFTPISDRIEAGTYMYAAALLGGDIRLGQIDPSSVAPVTAHLRQAGAHIETGPDWLTIRASGRPAPTQLTTAPWPGFPTDLQPPATVLAAIGKGTSTLTETVFENRFMHVPALCAMGADIRIHRNRMTIEGIPSLTGAHIYTTDLRAGAAMVLAGLAAEGQSVIDDSGHIRRGYASLVEKLRALGGDISSQHVEGR